MCAYEKVDDASCPLILLERLCVVVDRLKNVPKHKIGDSKVTISESGIRIDCNHLAPEIQ